MLKEIFEEKTQGKRKRRKIFGEGKFFCGGEGKGGKYSEKEDIFSRRRRRMEKEKEENIMEKEKCCRRQVQIGGSMT